LNWHSGNDPDPEVVMMAVRVRRISILIAVVAAAAVLVPVGNASRRDNAPSALPTLYVKYALNCTFAVFDDDGKRVSQINPGTYQIYVSTPLMFKLVVPGGVGVDHLVDGDMTGCRGWVQFQMTGPGIDLFTTLDSGCDAFLLMPAQNFKAGATYTLQDLNQPSVTRTALSVLSAGAAPVPVSPYTATSGKTSTFKDLVGSKVSSVLRGTFAGTIAGSLTTNGKLAVTTKGKAVSNLKPGRYKVTVLDETSKSGFTIQKAGGPAVTITGTKFLGRKSVAVNLKAGKWALTSGSGKVYHFTVAS
jgi:hypothetical protein